MNPYLWSLLRPDQVSDAIVVDPQDGKRAIIAALELVDEEVSWTVSFLLYQFADAEWCKLRMAMLPGFPRFRRHDRTDSLIVLVTEEKFSRGFFQFGVTSGVVSDQSAHQMFIPVGR